MKTINLPTRTTLDDLPKVQEIVRYVYKKQKGSVALFGKWIGALFVHSPTEAVVLDLDGNAIENVSGRFWPFSIEIQDCF